MVLVRVIILPFTGSARSAPLLAACVAPGATELREPRVLTVNRLVPGLRETGSGTFSTHVRDIQGKLVALAGTRGLPRALVFSLNRREGPVELQLP